MAATTAAANYEAAYRRQDSLRWLGERIGLFFSRLGVIRWTLTIFLTLVVFSALLPWLQKFGIGRLPGDARVTLFGRTFFLPFGSTLLLSMLAAAVGRLL